MVIVGNCIVESPASRQKVGTACLLIPFMPCSRPLIPPMPDSRPLIPPMPDSRPLIRRLPCCSYLLADLSLECGTADHLRLEQSAVIFLFIYGLGIPLSLVASVLTWRCFRGRLDSHVVFSFLLRGYHEKFWYWEIVIMIRKLLVVCIIVYVEDTLLQTYLFMWVIGLALVIHLLARPFVQPVLYNTEGVSLATIYVTANLSLLFNPRYEQTEASVGWSQSWDTFTVVCPPFQRNIGLAGPREVAGGRWGGA